MRNKKFKPKDPAKLIFVIFFLFGSLFFLVGCFLAVSDVMFRQTAVSAPAVITDIITQRDSDGDETHDVYVTFKVNGETHHSKLGYYDSSMYVGGPATVWYRPENPSGFRSSGGLPVGLMFAGMGAIFALIGLIPLIIKRRKKVQTRWLLANGRRINAELTDVYRNNSYTVNGKSPYKIVCQWIAPDGKLHEFESENLWTNPAYLLEKRQITRFPVYLDSNNFRKYYLDVWSILGEHF